MSNESKSTKELFAIVRQALEKDEELRATYQVKDKFRFIRDRLKALSTQVEESLTSITSLQDERKSEQLTEDEVLIYVYLFNAQGSVLQSWLKMLLPSVFYEYSINRPIYAERTLVENVIRSKANKQQHAFIIFAQQKQDILLQTEKVLDNLGYETIKIKDGSLKAGRLIGFMHNGIEYRIENNDLVKKEA